MLTDCEIIKSPLLSITNGHCQLKTPVTKPIENFPAASYQIGNPIQLSKSEAAIMCNIRPAGVWVQDIEVGNDMIPFSELDNIDTSKAIPLTRSEEVEHPKTGEPLMVYKFPASYGFVPHGAKLDNGKSHPHAGTGFGLYECIGFPKSHSVKDWTYIKEPVVYSECQEYRYDGKEFEVTDTKKLHASEILDDWFIESRGVARALPDGEDFLLPVCGMQKDEFKSSQIDIKQRLSWYAGVSRWRFDGQQWKAVSFTPVILGGNEPSIVRDIDGSILFTARIGTGIFAWRSNDHGESFEKTLSMDSSVQKNTHPVLINRTVGGTVYIASNPSPDPYLPAIYGRKSQTAWVLSPDRRGVADIVPYFDCDKLFKVPNKSGTSPNRSPWQVDHPVGGVVQLGDKLHSLLTFRVAEAAEVHGTALPTVRTGCWIEKVWSDQDGDAYGDWKFS